MVQRRGKYGNRGTEAVPSEKYAGPGISRLEGGKLVDEGSHIRNCVPESDVHPAFARPFLFEEAHVGDPILIIVRLAAANRDNRDRLTEGVHLFSDKVLCLGKFFVITH